MADYDQNVSAINKVQKWKEYVTGYFARLNASILYGISTGSAEQAIACTTGGNLHAELQGSTEAIGHVVLDLSTAKIGALQASTESIGLVTAIASTAIIGALYPTTGAIGIVSGHMTFPTVALAVTTSGAYTSGDCVGGVTSLASAFRSTAMMTGILQSLHIFDKGTTACAGMDLFFLDTATTGTAPANDTACDFDDSDLTKIVAHVSVTSGDYHIFNDNSVAIKDNLGIPVRATTGTTLYLVAVNTSTGPVFGTTGDVNLKLGILAD